MRVRYPLGQLGWSRTNGPGVRTRGVQPCVVGRSGGASDQMSDYALEDSSNGMRRLSPARSFAGPVWPPRLDLHHTYRYPSIMTFILAQF